MARAARARSHSAGRCPPSFSVQSRTGRLGARGDASAALHSHRFSRARNQPGPRLAPARLGTTVHPHTRRHQTETIGAEAPSGSSPRATDGSRESLTARFTGTAGRRDRLSDGDEIAPQDEIDTEAVHRHAHPALSPCCDFKHGCHLLSRTGDDLRPNGRTATALASTA